VYENDTIELSLSKGKQPLKKVGVQIEDWRELTSNTRPDRENLGIASTYEIFSLVANMSLI
jgi:hypothetical protein